MPDLGSSSQLTDSQSLIIGGHYMADQRLLAREECVAVTVSVLLREFTRMEISDRVKVNRDDFTSRFRLTNCSQEMVMRSIE